MSIKKVTLSNGVEIPVIGIGMDQVKDPEQAYESVMYALETGYRSIDTATAYFNEAYVGRAIKSSKIPRDQIFVTSKLNNPDQGYDRTLKAYEKTLKAFELDYLDSYLIHWPGKYLYKETWRAMERLYQEKMVRAIGVCNFNPHHIESLECEVIPMINQIEWHPYLNQERVGAYCSEKNILLEAWSPLMCGGEVLKDEVIKKIAAKHKKSSAQIILRWHIQKGRRIFPKSVTPGRIKENFEIFDFALEDEEVRAIDKLGEKNIRIGPDPDIFFYR